MDLSQNTFDIFTEICMSIFALTLIRGIFKMRNYEESRFGKILTCIGSVVISNMYLIIYFMWACSKEEKGGVVGGIIYFIGYLIVHYWNFSDLIKKD